MCIYIYIYVYIFFEYMCIYIYRHVCKTVHVHTNINTFSHIEKTYVWGPLPGGNPQGTSEDTELLGLQTGKAG